MSTPASPRRRQKVAVLVSLLPNKLGSMEEWLNGFAEALSRDFDVAVATYGPCHPSVQQRFDQCRARWHDLAMIERDFGSARAFLQQHADIAHFSLFAPRSPAVIAANTLPLVRVIFQDCHSTPTGTGTPSLPSRLLDRVTFLRTARVVGVSEYVANRLHQRFGLTAPKLCVVYNGVSTERFRIDALPSASRETVCVAALIPDKGVDVLIRAFAQPALANESLTICGDGGQRAALEELAAELGIENRVQFLGVRNDVHVIVGRAALVVHPAIWEEAFGLTIAEAMAAGRPVVGCRVGAVPELLGDDRTGVLIPPGDPEALAVAIAQLLADPARRDAIGAAARQRVEERFTMTNWVNQHVRIVAEVAGLTPAV